MLIDREELWNDIAKNCLVVGDATNPSSYFRISGADILSIIVNAPIINAIPVDWITIRYLPKLHDMLDEARADGNDEYTDRLYHKYEAIRYLLEDWKKANEQ